MIFTKRQRAEYRSLPLAESKAAYWAGPIAIIALAWTIYTYCSPSQTTIEMPSAEAEMDKILKERGK